MKPNIFLLIFTLLLIMGFAKNDFKTLNKKGNLNELKKTQNWILSIQNSNGLLESAENTNFVSLYDNSLAALTFIAEGKIENAEKIFDFFNTKISEELLNGSGGFYQHRDKNGKNGGSTWMGDNAWLLIALNNYHATTKNKKYETLANELEKWLRSLQDTDGGLWGGYRENGAQIHKITEGIITAFNAVEGYDDFHKNILMYLKKERWNTNDQLMVAWPSNPIYYYAMDLHALSYCIFKDYPENTLQEANRYLNSKTTTVTGEKISGYCFDQDKDVIWLEGTAQMALAYNQANLITECNAIIKNIEKTFISSTHYNNAIGVPYASNQGSSYGKEFLWDHADTSAAISSTAWYLFVKMNFNPLQIGRNKNIPVEDMFWLQKTGFYKE